MKYFSSSCEQTHVRCPDAVYMLKKITAASVQKKQKQGNTKQHYHLNVYLDYCIFLILSLTEQGHVPCCI